jgi:hypothetical protein
LSSRYVERGPTVAPLDPVPLLTPTSEGWPSATNRHMLQARACMQLVLGGLARLSDRTDGHPPGRQLGEPPVAQRAAASRAAEPVRPIPVAAWCVLPPAPQAPAEGFMKANPEMGGSSPPTTPLARALPLIFFPAHPPPLR